tara:strand:+ start:126 stop:1067 length:942 start_codon:yes stop_codon:yes gene_type:complete
MKLLISLPYSNSQWVYQVLKTHHRYHSTSTTLLPHRKGTTKYGKKKIYYSETGNMSDIAIEENKSDFDCDNLLDDSYRISTDNFWDSVEDRHEQLKEPMIRQKIRWIEMSKRVGLDVCYNVETSNLIGDVKEWFKNFHKRNQTMFYVLLNRNLWRHWIRFLFFYNLLPKLNEKLKYKAKPVDFTDFVLNTRHVWNFDLIKAYITEYKITFAYDKEIWKLFLENLRFLHEEIIGLNRTASQRVFAKEILWLEDLSNESLVLKFDCPSPLWNDSGQSRLNYEVYFPKEDLEFSRNEFNRYMEREFVHYGYALGNG